VLIDRSVLNIDFLIHRAWAWTFFESVVDLPDITEPPSTVQIICKATDASYNVQPDTVAGIWNLRGINNNAWHRVTVQIIPEEIVEEEEDEEVSFIFNRCFV
jgi:sulfite oxidase